jgi:hypothetical protein
MPLDAPMRPRNRVVRRARRRGGPCDAPADRPPAARRRARGRAHVVRVGRRASRLRRGRAGRALGRQRAPVEFDCIGRLRRRRPYRGRARRGRGPDVRGEHAHRPWRGRCGSSGSSGSVGFSRIDARSRYGGRSRTGANERRSRIGGPGYDRRPQHRRGSDGRTGSATAGTPTATAATPTATAAAGDAADQRAVPGRDAPGHQRLRPTPGTTAERARQRDARALQVNDR